MVLLHYRVPAFSYTSANGQDVVQWGEGVALSDPGFGEIYWNASLIQAVADESFGGQRPYRYAKTFAATDTRGVPLIDPRDIPETSAYMERFYGSAKTEVMGFVTSEERPDQTPVVMAAALDVMALSLAESGANDAPQINIQYLGGSKGIEKSSAPKIFFETAGDVYDTVKKPFKEVKTANDLIYLYTGEDFRGELKKRFDKFKKGSDLYDVVDSVEKIGKSGVNVYKAATTDLSSGDLPLTGKYSTAGDQNKNFNSIAKDIRKTIEKNVAFDKLWEDYKSGKISKNDLIKAGKGKALDRLKLIAKGTVAAGDIFIAGKGMLDAENDATDRIIDGYKLEQRRHEQQVAKIKEEAKDRANKYVEDLRYTDDDPYKDGYDTYHPNWDHETNDWRVGTYQWQQRQSGTEEKKPSKKKRTRTLKLSTGDGPGYPTADRTPIKKRPKPVEEEVGDPDAWIFTETDQDIARRELAEYQDEIFRERDRLEAVKDAERNERIRKGKENPVKWVPVEFEGPEQSKIEFTKFDGNEDENWLRFTEVMAYDYGDLSGKVATDLSPHQEFITKYGLRRLERLATQAGYPNLASALADWENLTERASDAGFRQWARTQPGCYMACTNIQGLWTQKMSQLALGDLLNDSRDLFSTAGLSDVSIGSLILTIFIVDFALEDGDAIQLIVSQFGREIFNSSFVLTNAGQTVSIPVRPGVANVQFVALNEGEFPPNTAGVTITGVTEGEDDQEYQLATGEAGTLRVNVRQ